VATPATAAPTTSSVEPKDETAQLGKERETNLRTGYDQLCQSYRAIDGTSEQSCWDSYQW
jgi:hypothetical protein